MHPTPILFMTDIVDLAGWFCKPVMPELAPWIMWKVLSVYRGILKVSLTIP